MTQKSSDPFADRPRNAEEGYVLLMVLAAIFVLSAIAAASMTALSRSSEAMRALQAAAATERALLEAEAEAAFVYLTSPPVAGGVYTGAPETYRIDFDTAEFDVEPRDWTADLLWSAAGGVRLHEAPGIDVRIAYRDGAALVPINGAGPDLLDLLFEALDLEAERVRLGATLADYTDADDIRRFQGAERAEYRLRDLEPPTNSPLRSLHEVLAVLDWPASLEAVWPDFLMLATERFIPGLALEFADERLRETEAGRTLLRQASQDGAALFLGGRPAPVARFILHAEGSGFARIIEIERTSGGGLRPFNRQHVGDLQSGWDQRDWISEDGEAALVRSADAESP